MQALPPCARSVVRQDCPAVMVRVAAATAAAVGAVGGSWRGWG